MSERKPPGGESLYRGPSKAPRDKRERERDRREQGDRCARASGGSVRGIAPPRERAAAPASRANARHCGSESAANVLRGIRAARDAVTPRPVQEQRMYGLNACLALFAQRPRGPAQGLAAGVAHSGAQSRACLLREATAWATRSSRPRTWRRLSGSAHHEGVVFGAMPAEELSLSAWLRDSARARPAIGDLARWRRQSAQLRRDPAQRRAFRRRPASCCRRNRR